ncbi:hypothetical protein GQ55_4G047700 [Panicum hallii var. hallii]|uniref:Uncharacterized protein n=1 Tax=Panicum hallii var. hallii TaxID=1504633 RepID=A0A2T7DVB3_9POAL|nr:hypothetical protein GQ55_4G047700 [Panicum hallii var. hallii]
MIDLHRASDVETVEAMELPRQEPPGLVDDRLVCAWLPVCHTCSPTRGVIGCCGWRARSQACRTGHDHLLPIL